MKPALYLAGLLFAVSVQAETGADCIQFARTVEIIDTMSPEERDRFETELTKQNRQDSRVIFTLRALNFLKMGGTKTEAWEQCGSNA